MSPEWHNFYRGKKRHKLLAISVNFRKNRVTSRWVCKKIAKNVAQPIFGRHLIHNFYRGKKRHKLLAISVNFRKNCTKKKIHPICENSPNLVTLYVFPPKNFFPGFYENIISTQAWEKMWAFILAVFRPFLCPKPTFTRSFQLSKILQVSGGTFAKDVQPLLWAEHRNIFMQWPRYIYKKILTVEILY
jgi:hypothetical protein